MHRHVPALVLLLAISVPAFAADQVIIPHQCSKIRRNYENRTSSIPSIFEKFGKNRRKSGKFSRNAPEMRRNTETGNTDKSTGLADKSADFLENRCGDIRAVFVRKWLFFVENRKWN
jgi:hypothetical protein